MQDLIQYEGENIEYITSIELNQIELIDKIDKLIDLNNEFINVIVLLFFVAVGVYVAVNFIRGIFE